MGKLFVALSVGVLGGIAAVAQSGAKTLYNAPSSLQNVGIHDWLQARDGTRFTERMPVASTGPFTLHIRSNRSGFLGVWTTSDGAMLTPVYEGYAGHLIEASSVYVVPAEFRLSRSESDGRVVVLFARSQTEQVRDAEAARRKLDGRQPFIVTEFDDVIGPGLGTYVVNRVGSQPGVVLPLTR